MPAKVKKTKTKKVEAPEAVYPEVVVRVCAGLEQSLTASQAKEIIGWQVEGSSKFKTDYLLKNTDGKKVRCVNNVSNRPFYLATCNALVQDILHGNWKFNGEPIIVGEFGFVLNGQHTLSALILANELWEKSPESYPAWNGPPQIEKMIVFGVKEDDKTINTMDTCKPRSLADVLYRSEFFKDHKASERRKIARTCSYAIRTVWERLGVRQALSITMTHAELLGFLEKHMRLVEAVNFIQIENGHENILNSICSLGTLSGLLYLMASSKSDPEAYRYDQTENSLDFSNWDKAEEFFVLISSKNKAVDPLLSAIKDLGSLGSRAERVALVCKAWRLWLNGKLANGLQLRYTEQEGLKVLAEVPLVGGIDGLFTP